MFKKVLAASVHEIAENTKLVRISFLTGFFSNLRHLIFFGYTINNVLHYKYNLTPDTLEIANIIINWCVDNGLAAISFGIVLFAFISIIIIGPLGTAVSIFLLDTKKVDRGKAFTFYFSVVVLNATLELFTMESRQIGNFARMYMINITDNVLVQIIIGILAIILIVCTILFPFALFFLLLGGNGSDHPESQAGSSLGKSASLVASNIGTTIKFTILQFFLQIRFFINLAIVVGVPSGILYLMLSQGRFSADTRILIAVSVGLFLLLLVVYIDALINAFFLTFWYKLYTVLLGKPLEDTNESHLEEKKQSDASTSA